MLTAIIITRPELRDALVSYTSGIKQSNASEGVIFYQKNSYIFAFSSTLSLRDIFDETIREYQPEKIFITDTARSIDTEHEIGDIILPNVFFSYNSEIETADLGGENRDSFIKNARFLEIFDEQKDYFVEDYGLSIGGIVVENVPNNPDFNEKLALTYEADAYSDTNLDEAHKIIAENLVPTILLIGIVEWKINTKSLKPAFQLIAENIMTTIRLLNDEENSY